MSTTQRHGIGRRIMDPRILSEEVGGNPDPSPSVTSPMDTDNIYSNLAGYTFGNARASPHASLVPPSSDAVPEANEPISPLTTLIRRSSLDHTPRPSVSGQPASLPLDQIRSHPSQGVGHPASNTSASSSQSRRHSPTTETSRNTTIVFFWTTDGEESEYPTSNTDHMIDALYSPSHQRGRVMPDNASQHTFGHGSRQHGVSLAASSQDAAAAIASSSSVSVASSRSSSRASMRTTELFSSDDEVEIGYYDGCSSPVTFARDFLADIDEDVDVVDPGPSLRRPSIFDGRRASLPMAIPGGDASSVRSREGSVLTLRRPNSTVVVPKSEPQSRADWRSLEAQVQAQQQQAADSGNAYDGFDLRFILSKHYEGSTHSSNGSHSRLSSIAPFPVDPSSIAHFVTVPRRTSTVTLQSNEDTFFGYVRKHDQTFGNHWAFMREKADVPSVVVSSSSSSRQGKSSTNHPRVPNTSEARKSMPPGTQEIWRCGHVGRFKVDRLAFKPQSAEPTKAAQHRIHIRHIPDPYVRGNTTTGPHSVIHKHSRAIAFSLFRSHNLLSGRRSGAGSDSKSQNTHMNTRLGIMLAPKKVQEQYTSTKSTRQLSTHGLLDDNSRGSKHTDKGTRRGTQSLSTGDRDSRDKDKKRAQREEKAKAKAASKGKAKAKDKKDKKHHDPMNLTESAESSSGGSVTKGSIQQIVSAPVRSATKVQFSLSISSSATVGSGESVSSPVSPRESLPPSIVDSIQVSESDTSIPLVRHHRDYRDSIDSDDRLPTRTPHAEAFGTLDPNDIEHYRSKANSRAIGESSSTLTERIFRVFRGSSRSDGPSSVAARPHAYQPPWLSTASRDQQEVNDRVIHDLNASFRDVGLLHTLPHKSSLKSTSKSKPHQEVFEQIPDDCLYMLLPLWAGETDTPNAQTQGSETASVVTIHDNRQYLLVYYVPFDNPNDKKPELLKKRAKQSHSSDSGTEVDPKSVFFPAFHVSARVITYEELRLTGIRVPSDGLAITGPAKEATNCPVPIPSQKDIQVMDTVICVCHGRDQGFVLLTEGLCKLGLATSEVLRVHNPESELEEREYEVLLTTIGRAAVEMVWLGCLAITSFGPV
ncbi:hypothetical protein BU15DRAFT_88725 [Melanogaster broomeanus]|nr:hypothetical protein BU15DRAFT_88725 [Melanogaster broomeanus]